MKKVFVVVIRFVLIILNFVKFPKYAKKIESKILVSSISSVVMIFVHVAHKVAMRGAARLFGLVAKRKSKRLRKNRIRFEIYF